MNNYLINRSSSIFIHIEDYEVDLIRYCYDQLATLFTFTYPTSPIEFVKDSDIELIRTKGAEIINKRLGASIDEEREIRADRLIDYVLNIFTNYYKSPSSIHKGLTMNYLMSDDCLNKLYGLDYLAKNRVLRRIGTDESRFKSNAKEFFEERFSQFQRIERILEFSR